MPGINPSPKAQTCSGPCANQCANEHSHQTAEKSAVDNTTVLQYYKHLTHKKKSLAGDPCPRSTCKAFLSLVDTLVPDCNTTTVKHSTCRPRGLLVYRHGSENLSATPEHAFSPVCLKCQYASQHAESFESTCYAYDETESVNVIHAEYVLGVLVDKFDQDEDTDSPDVVACKVYDDEVCVAEDLATGGDMVAPYFTASNEESDEDDEQQFLLCG